MKTTFTLILIGLFISNESLACAERLPNALALASFGPVIFDVTSDNPFPSGTVKAKIAINRQGKVTKVEILEVNPKGLEPGPIEKAIYKAKFTTQREVKDYIYEFQFGS